MAAEDRSAATGSREALELCLRSLLDDDDAVSAAQIVIGEGWRPPDEVAALCEALEVLLRFARPVDIQACEVQGGVDVRAALERVSRV